MTAGTSKLKMSELLVQSGVASEAQVAQALPMSKKTGLPLGRVLVETGIVSPLVVRGAILAQALIHDNLLHVDLALSALNMVQAQNMQFEEALEKLGWRAEYCQRIRDLGKTLLKLDALVNISSSQLWRFHSPADCP